ncbi:uncharacterized protein si:ch211-191i18.4 [Periophthalmus magnuspinnatus]|uniref:uncharacterized protein si:ch211-191i18.4 n=1 Tax=Periophthalmus magnuspinnatus TaxID=409849 RepID=UPI00145AB91E|nr:uncharacterized protein si:ch211-191i18.4 [Periophthalmus magnuspinnatus]
MDLVWIQVWTLVWTLVFGLLLGLCESRPETSSARAPEPPQQMSSTAPLSDQSQYHRLPGLCHRLKRRRITVMCNLEKFCWPLQDQTRTRSRSGHVCRCPRGLRCSHYFIHSLR